MPTKKEFTLQHNRVEIEEELLVAYRSESVGKDILIVVKDQYEYIKNCLESIYENTENFHIYLWDNGSKEKTADFLRSESEKANVDLIRSEENTGFICPNNRLAERGKLDYLILLNSDTIVRCLWDRAMIGWLQTHEDVAEVGYLGGWLDKDGKGYRFGFGPNVDYLCGWALCISRDTYSTHGLFDEENLEFAYGEDSDLSLRLRNAGKRIYALHSDLIVHYENKTVNEVKKERDIKMTFNKNHNYIKNKWQMFLNN